MWPWNRRLADADRKLAEAEERGRAVEQIVDQARQATAAVHREAAKNSWTEKLTASMQPRRQEGY
ncbi:hypothetical protein R2325_14110 [Mycobacteroides chelonae]|nr:hypothetical protein [Mycobacteroides chelonae]MEC4873161.1 hypothetical protein [Mycobacteroides chelonae]